jgi:hypothetical protein
MAGNRTLKLSILADIDGLKKGLAAGDKEIDGFGGKLEKFGKVAAAAFAAAAAAAAAYAGKLLIDGVKAAIEDEAAQKRLQAALENVTGATDEQVASVEKQITQLSVANGIADDQLRPAYQRLATATGDLQKSNDLLNVALDISAGTGRDVEAVSNALAKAYEGNVGALTRLGVGLTAAEAKSMTFDEITQKLADTFEGQASVKAETFAGQMAQLSVRFDEAKESVGTALLPQLTKFLNLLVDDIIPKVQEFGEKALKPVRDAIEENKEELQALYDFGKEFLVPFIGKTLVVAFEGAGKAIAAIIKGISLAVDGIKAVINTVIDAINAAIKAYNALPFVDDIKTVKKVGSEKETGAKASGSNNVPTGSLPFGGGKAMGGMVVPNTAYIVGERGPELFVPQTSGTIVPNNKTATSVTVNVYAPSAMDEEGFTRAVVNALNNSQYRSGSGGGQLVL